ncbi:MAG: DUF4234 domain-containing protein [Clostridia bacterium]|nr:DUF4234 domain-containing protein [Clostridia bacterium]
MKKRNLFFMFIVFYNIPPIYLLYWIGSIQSDIHLQSPQDNKVSGGVAVLLTILTFGLYGFVWQWKVCEHIKRQGGGDLRVITLVLSILIFGVILNPFIIQGSINSIVRSNSTMKLD